MALHNIYIAQLNRNVVMNKKPGETIKFTTSTPRGLEVEVTITNVTHDSIEGVTPYATSGDVKCIMLVHEDGHTTVVLHD